MLKKRDPRTRNQVDEMMDLKRINSDCILYLQEAQKNMINTTLVYGDILKFQKKKILRSRLDFLTKTLAPILVPTENRGASGYWV